MSINMRRIINCPICQTQFTIALVNFAGQIQITCNRCDTTIINWIDNELIGVQKNKKLVKTGSNPKMKRAHTAKRIPIATKNRVEESSPKQETSDNFEQKTKTKTKTKFTLQSTTLERIGDYNIIKCINSGSMGEIYLAQHIGVKNYAAIKLLNSKLEKDMQAAERFKQEARVHSRLEHPNIVSIYDVDSYNGKLYIVMEYIEGESLEKVLRTRTHLNPKHTLKISIAVAKALEHALKQKIIHRDLKPANIMIDRRNRKVKLADFGLGKILEEDGATLTGQMMGTAYYMAPEQVYSAKEVDHKADIYALGATIYHMLSGRPPYSEIKGAINILKAKVNQNPEPIENMPKEIMAIVSKAMHLNANKRYQSPTKMKKAMENALDNL